MRLFHVSEESDIQVFVPRTPTRTDLNHKGDLVWAINERCLPNFLTPRNCPRVTYHVGNNTTKEDKQRFFTSKTCNHVVVLEADWYEQIKNTTLYLYEFDPLNFVLQDEIAGYYVSTKTQIPIRQYVVNDILGELLKCNVEVCFTDRLWDIYEEVKNSSLHYSMCRMAFAQEKTK